MDKAEEWCLVHIGETMGMAMRGVLLKSAWVIDIHVLQKPLRDYDVDQMSKPQWRQLEVCGSRSCMCFRCFWRFWSQPTIPASGDGPGGPLKSCQPC